jgi:hypothetical protein
MRLSNEQMDFFETFGYLKFPGLLRNSIEWITQEFENVFPTKANISAHDGTARTCIVPFIDQRERLSALLDDPRIEGIFASLLGDDFNYMGSDGNYYVGDTGWHRDGNHPHYRHIKMAFYLDALDGSLGALRVIPGSHRLDDTYAKVLGAKAHRSQEHWGIAGAEIPAVVIDVVPGDILIFNHNLMHSSWGGGNRRRMFTINVCQRYKEADLDQLKDYIAGHARFWIDRNYGEIMMNTAGAERMKHLEQVMANDGHLAALSAKARLEMSEPARG